MTGTTRGAGGEAGAAESEQEPAGQPLGIIVPRVDVRVEIVGGRLDGDVRTRVSWNAGVNLARAVLAHTGLHRDVLDYELDDAELVTPGLAVVRLRPGRRPR